MLVFQNPQKIYPANISSSKRPLTKEDFILQLQTSDAAATLPIVIFSSWPNITFLLLLGVELCTIWQESILDSIIMLKYSA